MFLLGSVADGHGDDRWAFAAGAVRARAGWFAALGFGARTPGRWLATPRSWRVLGGIVMVVMIALTVGLVLS